MLKRFLTFFTSLKLTVVLLGIAVLLVFIGTLAQVDQGLYQAQTRYFKSFLIFWSPKGATWKVPVFPGGYLLGTVLLANLIAAHVTRFKMTRKKVGILMIHFGVILLLLGQLLTDMLSAESAMKLQVGETKNYSEDFHQDELVLIDTSEPSADRVISVPTSLVAKRGEVALPQTPLSVRVKKFWENSDVLEAPEQGAQKVEASEGVAA